MLGSGDVTGGRRDELWACRAKTEGRLWEAEAIGEGIGKPCYDRDIGDQLSFESVSRWRSKVRTRSRGGASIDNVCPLFLLNNSVTT